MNKTQDLDWLHRKLEVLSSFDGALSRYVTNSINNDQLVKFNANSSKIVRLDSNENYFVKPDFINELFIKIFKSVDLRIYDPQAITNLRKALGAYVGVPFDCVVLGSGSEHLVDFIVNFFLEKNDEAISIEPSFFMYGKRVLLRNAKIIKVPLKKDLSLDVDGILERITDKTKLIFVCSPNNPTGNQFSWDEIKKLADESSAIVVVDEAYAEFGDFSICPKAVTHKNIVVVRTFSKSFGLAGLRFGYVVAHNNFASVLSEAIPYTVSTITAKFVQELLSNVEVVTQWNNCVKEQREKLIENLSLIEGITVFNSKTNFVTFKINKPQNWVYNKLIERGIILKNLGNLPLLGECLRVTVGLPEMNAQFLSALTKIMKLR